MSRDPTSAAALSLLHLTAGDAACSPLLPPQQGCLISTPGLREQSSEARRCSTVLEVLKLVAVAARELRGRKQAPAVGDHETRAAEDEGTRAAAECDVAEVAAGSKRRRDASVDESVSAPPAGAPAAAASAHAHATKDAAQESTHAELRKLVASAEALLGAVFGAAWNCWSSLDSVADAVAALSGDGDECWGGHAIVTAIEALVVRGGILVGPVRDLCLAERLRPLRFRLVRALVGSVVPLSSVVCVQSLSVVPAHVSPSVVCAEPAEPMVQKSIVWHKNIDARGVAEFVWGAARDAMLKGGNDSVAAMPGSDPQLLSVACAEAPSALTWASVASAVRDRLLPLISAASPNDYALLSVASTPAVKAAAAAGEKHAQALVAACQLSTLRAKRTAAAAALEALRPSVRQHEAAVASARSAVEAAARFLPSPGLSQYSQPAALLPERPDIQAFFRGSERTKTFPMVEPGISNARDFAKRCFGGPRGQGYYDGRGYAADAFAHGCGSNTRVTVTKRDAGAMHVAAHAETLRALAAAQQAQSAVAAREAEARNKLDEIDAAIKAAQEPQ